MAKKTIITVATTGAWPKKENNPNVPMTPREIAEDVYDCWKAGAAIAHLHMRDDEGNGSMDTAKFRETVEILRGEHPDCDIVLNMTTSGALIKDEDLRKAHLRELRPEMGTFDCGSMNWLHSAVFLNSPQFLESLGKDMQEWGIKPEIEVFDPGMIGNAAYFLKKGRAEGSAALPVLHGLCQRHSRLHEKSGVHEGNDGDSVPRLHLELLRRGPLCAGDDLWRGRHGRPYPRGHGGQRDVLQGRAGPEQPSVCGARGADHPGVWQRGCHAC